MVKARFGVLASYGAVMIVEFWGPFYLVRPVARGTSVYLNGGMGFVAFVCLTGV